MSRFTGGSPIPGSYIPDKPITTVAKFDPDLSIFSSKQRPRCLKIYGSDGVKYTFLLKGHEDIRQDERVPLCSCFADLLTLYSAVTPTRPGGSWQSNDFQRSHCHPQQAFWASILTATPCTNLSENTEVFTVYHLTPSIPS